MIESLHHIAKGDYLYPYVRCYWSYADSIASTSVKFPIGSTQIIFHKGLALYNKEIETRHSTVTLSGQMNHLSHLESTGGLDMIIVFLTPIGMSCLFDFPISEIYNREISAVDINDKELIELGNRVCDCQDNSLCFYIIDLWLRKRLSESYIVNRIAGSLKELELNPFVDFCKIADISCYSRKQFGRVFKDIVGVNPKEYQRILRFQRALYLMQQGCRDEQKIAIECNYTDSSHLIREFKHFTGFTPLESLDIRPAYSDFYSSPTLSSDLVNNNK